MAATFQNNKKYAAMLYIKKKFQVSKNILLKTLELYNKQITPKNL